MDKTGGGWRNVGRVTGISGDEHLH